MISPIKLTLELESICFCPLQDRMIIFESQLSLRVDVMELFWHTYITQNCFWMFVDQTLQGCPTEILAKCNQHPVKKVEPAM